MPDNTRSRDFRYVFANTFGVAFGPSEVQLLGGIQLRPGTDDNSMEEQIGIIITHPAAKLLAQMLNKFIEHFENVTGAPIPLDPDRLKTIEDAIAVAEAARQAAIKAKDEEPK